MKRATLFRWAQQWELSEPDFVAYENERLWLTTSGVSGVRTRFVMKTLTRGQIMSGKNQDAARKFTARHRHDIQAAVQRGDALEVIAKMLRMDKLISRTTAE